MLINLTVSSGALSPTTTETSVTYNGSTWSFDTGVTAGTFVTGEPFVVSDQAFNITQVTPVSSDIQSDTYIGNGLVLNPFIAESDSWNQGFDGYYGVNPSGELSYVMPYDAAKNIDPTLTATNISVSLNDVASYVKMIRLASKTNTTSASVAEAYNVLTILDAVPLANSIRPGMTGTTKTIRQRPTDFTPRSHTLPASWPTISAIIASVPSSTASLVDEAEKRNYLRLEGGIGEGTYSANVAEKYGQFLSAMNSSAPSAAQREAMVDKALTFWADIEAVLDEGYSLGGGAGQGGGIWLWGMAAAALYKDASIKTKVLAASLQPNSPFWVDVDNTTGVVINENRVSTPFFTEQIGQPWVLPSVSTGAHHGRYQLQGGMVCVWEVLGVCSFSQGPATFANGAEMILDGHGSTDTDFFNGALLGYAERYRHFYDIQWTANSYNPSLAYVDGWDQVIGFGDFTPWAGVPDQPVNFEIDVADNYFSAGDGTVTLNTQGIDYAPGGVTRTDVRVSLDNIQFVENTSVTVTANEFAWTGLLKGVVHYCGWRRGNAAGLGPWSLNVPKLVFNSGLERSKVTTTGTDTLAAPTYTGGTSPLVHKRLYPQWEYATWGAAGTTLTANEVELAAGVGYPVAYPAPTYAYDWETSATGGGAGFSTTGVTTAIYTRALADAEQFLRCKITATNSQGSEVAYTNEVECPAVTVLPAGTLIDTDFTGSWPIDYSSEVTSISATSCTYSHVVQGTLGGKGDSSGYIFFDKDATNPTGYFDINVAAATSTTYNVDLEAVVAWARNVGVYTITIEEVNTGTPLLTITKTAPGDLDAEQIGGYPGAGQSIDAVTFSYTGSQFTTGTETALRFKFASTNTRSGSTFDGDWGIQKLKIVAV